MERKCDGGHTGKEETEKREKGKRGKRGNGKRITQKALGGFPYLRFTIDYSRFQASLRGLIAGRYNAEPVATLRTGRIKVDEIHA